MNDIKIRTNIYKFTYLLKCHDIPMYLYATSPPQILNYLSTNNYIVIDTVFFRGVFSNASTAHSWLTVCDSGRLALEKIN